MKGWLVVGVLLIVVGLGLFWLNLMGIETVLLSPGPLFLGALGGAFLGAYVYTGAYAFLIPGCILCSLWLGVVLVELVPSWPGELEGATFMALLGGSFFAIYGVDRYYARQKRVWPVWPGAGLFVFAALLVLEGFVPETFTATLFIAGPGVVLLAIYFWRRLYTLLIPACYLIAFGIIIPYVESVPHGPGEEILMLALLLGAIGAGSLVIYVMDRLYTRASNWWPLIPGLVGVVGGGLLGLAGWGMAFSEAQWQLLARLASNLWPLLLIAFGAGLIFRWARRGVRATGEAAPPEET